MDPLRTVVAGGAGSLLRIRTSAEPIGSDADAGLNEPSKPVRRIAGADHDASGMTEGDADEARTCQDQLRGAFSWNSIQTTRSRQRFHDEQRSVRIECK